MASKSAKTNKQRVLVSGEKEMGNRTALEEEHKTCNEFFLLVREGEREGKKKSVCIV